MRGFHSSATPFYQCYIQNKSRVFQNQKMSENRNTSGPQEFQIKDPQPVVPKEFKKRKKKRY